jgi:peptidoglycan hydrolase-like protein with peptidoglycan-binding domain
MGPPGPFVVAQLKTLRKGATGEDVRWLHLLLNSRLPPVDEQLPVDGPGSRDFGPRTEAKVKRFQQAQKVDIGKPDYMDGVVGQHTWIALHQLVEVSSNILFVPQQTLKMPAPPSWPKPGLPPSTPPILPALKLKPDGMMQVQVGETTNIPFNGSPAALAHQVTLGFLVFGKVDGSTSQGQIGVIGSLNNGWTNPGGTSTVGVFGSLQTKNLPGSGERFTWSAQIQQALFRNMKQDGGGNSTTAINITGNISLLKDSQGNDVVQITGQTGPFVEIDTPNSVTNKWNAGVGWGVFGGITFSYSSYTPLF